MYGCPVSVRGTERPRIDFMVGGKDRCVNEVKCFEKDALLVLGVLHDTYLEVYKRAGGVWL